MNPTSAPGSLDILIPVRNGGEPLSRTLRALAESEDQDFRLLISDNYSTDGSPWKLSLDAFKPEQVVLIQPPEPLGRVEHWTWVARQAEATYCKLLLCGDRFPSDFLGITSRAFALEPDIIFAPYVILQHGKTLKEALKEIPLREAMTPLTGADYLKRCETAFNLIGPMSGVTFRTASLQAALPFDANYAWTADWRLFSRIMQKGTAVYCESTYSIQDRTIARHSSSFKGTLNGIYEEWAFRRELLGRNPATSFERFRETFRPVTALVIRHTLPPAISEPLNGLGRLFFGKKSGRA